VYKRLKFLGNRSISQAIALIFLAAWHGLHIGYYVCFFNELIVMLFEKDVSIQLKKNVRGKLLILLTISDVDGGCGGEECDHQEVFYQSSPRANPLGTWQAVCLLLHGLLLSTV